MGRVVLLEVATPEEYRPRRERWASHTQGTARTVELARVTEGVRA